MTEKREIDDYLPSKREETLPVKRVGCKECDGSGWIKIDQPHGQLIAKRCECYKKYIADKDKPQWGEKFKRRKG